MRQQRKLLVWLGIICMFVTVFGTNVYAAGGIRINKSSVTLYTTSPKTTTLKTNVSGTVKWTSSNSRVATVSSTGKVTAKSSDSAVITATYKSSKATCKITVIKPSIKLDKTKLTLNTNGKSVYLKATVKGPSRKITWKSSNTSVAGVSTTGKVVPRKAGTAVIYAKANGVTARCTVTVKKVDYSGVYTVDVEQTHAHNSMSLQSYFGSGIKYGYEMKLNKDGSASWYIAIGYGGKGTYKFSGAKGVFKYYSYEDGWNNKLSLSVVKEAGMTYIVMDLGGELPYKLYWKK